MALPPYIQAAIDRGEENYRDMKKKEQDEAAARGAQLEAAKAARVKKMRDDAEVWARDELPALIQGHTAKGARQCKIGVDDEGSFRAEACQVLGLKVERHYHEGIRPGVDEPGMDSYHSWHVFW